MTMRFILLYLSWMKEREAAQEIEKDKKSEKRRRGSENS